MHRLIQIHRIQHPLDKIPIHNAHIHRNLQRLLNILPPTSQLLTHRRPQRIPKRLLQHLAHRLSRIPRCLLIVKAPHAIDHIAQEALVQAKHAHAERLHARGVEVDDAGDAAVVRDEDVDLRKVVVRQHGRQLVEQVQLAQHLVGLLVEAQIDLLQALILPQTQEAVARRERPAVRVARVQRLREVRRLRDEGGEAGDGGALAGEREAARGEGLQDVRVAGEEVGDVGGQGEARVVRDLWDELAVHGAREVEDGDVELAEAELDDLGRRGAHEGVGVGALVRHEADLVRAHDALRERDALLGRDVFYASAAHGEGAGGFEGEEVGDDVLFVEAVLVCERLAGAFPFHEFVLCSLVPVVHGQLLLAEMDAWTGALKSSARHGTRQNLLLSTGGCLPVRYCIFTNRA